MREALLSIDVGTASLRAALVNTKGKILAKNIQKLKLWQTSGIMEQSSDDIYGCLVNSIRKLIEQYHQPVSIKGIGIDATASQVLLNHDLEPLHLPGNPEANILGWMDHRSQPQSLIINKQFESASGRNAPAKQIPEMCLSKMLWLKQEQPELWSQCGLILDLYDFITWKLTGVITRTPCSKVTCEPKEILKALNINNPELRRGELLSPCSPVPGGLSNASAEATGLPAGTTVATGMVDGLGGSLAALGPIHPEKDNSSLESRLSMVVGTSTIYVASSRSARTIEGVWGPMPSALEGFYHNIVGQSAAGALIEHLLTSHPSYAKALNESKKNHKSIYSYLNTVLKNMAGDTQKLSLLTYDIHLLPYFAGNRCPRMDMSLKGMMTGLSLDQSIDSLALTYLACIQAIALEARHNIERLTQNGYCFSELRPCGGLAKNTLFVQEHVNITGIRAKMPQEPDCMLLAGALLSSVACGTYASLEEAIQAMSQQKETLYPDTSLAAYCDKKYRIYLELYEDQKKYNRMMSGEFRNRKGLT
ncbi:FGGY-family carbohydrate kinase [Endozoicomonas sp. ONNA1]|uniref:FGGY-family carbohydrate kinase n=1 Tax=Endozoicomonas sp. ONNA1 TaxID=2828740 RepID=UPI0021484FB4|nr:FGGY-family carbohydrate kinase [Endozoicomonas sp. ONNA1]